MKRVIRNLNGVEKIKVKYLDKNGKLMGNISAKEAVLLVKNGLAIVGGKGYVQQLYF
jgi:hypothetical protein